MTLGAASVRFDRDEIIGPEPRFACASLFISNV